jgi:predicted HAD superfamily Cof-like phosphohydrolase
MTRDHISDTQLWFEKALPNPTSKNLHTQLGVHFEEVGEMMDALTARDSDTQDLLVTARTALHRLAEHLKAEDNILRIQAEDRIEVLDALCDQIVTAVGVGHMLNMDVPDGLAEVNRSNFSKFDAEGKPIFNENQKVMKGPNYRAPDLTAFT